ncbi:related to AOS1-Smt3p activating protein [Sporisorium reilianum SRZ2]|uniref:Related to AOS1-Smt3p activating protein n=1 Tax=Sporisorium reilianum (strain SRZ2) TaxID=999809 RepID=E6ZTC6_SPORE|nr:related to AOS1-Smt3p activating protein [Sporisorium reilianum SRZ2]
MAAASTSAQSASAQVESTNQAPPTAVTGNGGAVTEDEAALYDRQIRLWGLAAQNRLRSAHILIVSWNGIATEVIKNTVLSGIGSITVLDPTVIDGSVDLLSGFFFRDEEVGQPKCSQGPLDRVRALNPLVKVHGLSDAQSYETLLNGGEEAQAWLKQRGVDVVVADTPLPETQADGVGLREKLVILNDTARAAGIKFFLSATQGFGGFYFADQITHDYIIERSLPPPPSAASTSTTPSETTTEPKRIKRRQTFVPLSASLAQQWTGLTERQQRRTRIPLDWFIWLALTDLQSRLSLHHTSTAISAEALKDRTTAMIREKGLAPETVYAQFAAGAGDDAVARIFDSVVSVGGTGVALAPVASVVGGVLSQDILNSIGGREEPVVNWLFLSIDASGATNVLRIGDLPNPVTVD